MEKLIALLAIIILAGACEVQPPANCGYGPHENVVTDICAETESAEECSAIKAFARDETALTGIVDGNSFGTGVVIEGNRVLTALHVVAKARIVRFRQRELDANGEPTACHESVEMRIAAKGADDSDIAVLELVDPADAKRLPKPIGIAPELPAVGDTVWTFGLKSRWQTGVVTYVYSDGWLETTAVGQHGDSGAPVVDSLGRLVGIHAETARDRTFANEVSVPNLVGSLI